MPRFVILAHDWPAPHWDLLLDAGDALRAWRLLAEPTPGSRGPAERNADHRRIYLDYEGPVSGGRGTVSRYAAGEYADLGGGRYELTCPLWRGTFTLAPAEFAHSPSEPTPGGA